MTKPKLNFPPIPRLRKLMEDRQVKRDDLAQAIGVSSVAIGQYYNGETLPTIDKLIKIANYFNVSTDFLLEKSDVETSDTSIKNVCEYTGLSEEAVAYLHEKCCKKMEVISEDAKKRFNETDIIKLKNIHKERYIDNASKIFFLSEFIINKNLLLQKCIDYIKHQRTKAKIEKHINSISNDKGIGYKEFVEHSHIALQNRIGDCEYELFQIQQSMLDFIDTLKNKIIDEDIMEMKSNEALFYSTDIEYLKECIDLFYEEDVDNGNDK